MLARFGEKLRTLRKRENITLDDLADRLGYANNSYLSLLENGKKGPSAALVFKVSQLFGVSADVLLDDAAEVPE